MPTFRWSELVVGAIDPQHSQASGSVYQGESIAVARARYPAGTRITAHATPHEAVHSIITGRARFTVGGEEKAVGAGEAVLVRANVLHSAEILDDLEVVTFRDVKPDPGARPADPTTPAFYKWDEMESDLITPKYSASRGPTLLGDRMEVVYMFFPAGTEGKLHSHPNEQLQVVLQGKAIAVIEGKEFTLEAGTGILFPATLTHGARILEDYTVLNCKNVVPGWSTYHAQYQP
ncbi:MAG TPA: cupin domain-containing protein [Methylomirabilota bacterium]|nr:cupin domain-containing protein [Methylomirabilota bacterium]